MTENTKAEKNNPNDNYAMYEADRVAKAKAQPTLPSVTGEGNAPRDSFSNMAADLLDMAHIVKTEARIETLAEDLQKVSDELRDNLYDAGPAEAWNTLRKRIGGTENLMAYSNCLIVGKV